MSWNGAGVFNRIYSWVADKAAAINITASRMDTDTNDIVSNGFGNTLTRDGQGSATANLPMNSFRHTGVGAGVNTSDYATMAQLQGQSVNWGVATGTADAVALSVAPAVTALTDGMLFGARLSAPNATTTPTLAVSGLTPHTITKAGGAALAAGDLPANLAEALFRYNLASTRYELLNPASSVVGPGSATDGHLAVFNGATGKIIKDGGAFSVAAAQLAGSAIAFGAVMLNGTIVQSQAGGAQTFAIKTLAGTDPSATDPVYFLFHINNQGLGSYVVRTVTAALNITIPSGQAMGFANATPGRIWLGAMDNGGAVELFVINCLTGTSTYPLRNGFNFITTSAVSGGASSGVAYSTTARASLAYIPLGFATWETGGTMGTAGTWNVAPTRLALFQPGSTPLPGAVIQSQYASTGANASTANTYTISNTAPAPGNGALATSVAITPTSSANVMRVRGQALIGNTSGGSQVFAFIYDGSNTRATGWGAVLINQINTIGAQWQTQAGQLTQFTYGLYYASNNAGTVINTHTAATAELGGTASTYIQAEEIMA